MRHRNNGQGEDNILQNQFTSYLVTAIHWKKLTYIKRRIHLESCELPTDFDRAFVQTPAVLEDRRFSLEQPVLDSMMLAQALGRISDRERYILLAHTLEDRTFRELAVELGMGHKEVAAIYYRALQKLKKEM